MHASASAKNTLNNNNNDNDDDDDWGVRAVDHVRRLFATHTHRYDEFSQKFKTPTKPKMKRTHFNSVKLYGSCELL